MYKSRKADMTDINYESNGQEVYGDYYSDKPQKSGQDSSKKADLDVPGDADESGTASHKANEYVRELLAEKLLIDQNKLPNATRLLDQEVTKVQTSGKVPVRENKYVDIYREKPIKVTVKVLVPVREHPKFNFVGKLLGPKGNSMKRLQEETMCKMAVLGKGSMRDRAKEEECRNSQDPKYSHLSDDLHVEISALGPPAEAHARVAFALAEVRKYLIPDNNDHIRIEQMREMEIMGGDHPVEEREMRPRRPVPGIPRPAPPAMPRSGPPVMRTATRAPVPTSRVMPAKTKIMSILDRARVAMEESYGYEEDLYASSSPVYEYSSSRPYTSGYYDDYDVDYYKSSSSSYEPSSSRSWKNSSGPYAKSSSNAASSSRHAESSRYRSSPYSRPLK